MGSRGKKTAIIAIYEILKNYSSKDYPLSNRQISDYLKKNYEISLSRNTIKDNLIKLEELYGDDVICYQDIERQRADGKEDFYTYRYYFERGKTEDILTDEEIIKLIDVCLYARNLTYQEANDLNKKLRGMMTKEGRKKVNYIDDIPIKQFNENRVTSDNLKILREVIAKNREQKQQWVTFHFNYYNEKKQLVPLEYKKGRKKSKPREYRVLPLRICERNHKYYLVCAMKICKKDEDHKKKIDYKLYHYRIDLMTNLKDGSARESVKDLEELKKRLSAEHISDYISSHLYMFYDEPTRMKIEIPKVNGIANLTFLVDAFGLEAAWHQEKDKGDSVIVSIICSPNAMKVFLMQYADKNIKVIDSIQNGIQEEINQKIRESCEKLLETISSNNAT